MQGASNWRFCSCDIFIVQSAAAVVFQVPGSTHVLPSPRLPLKQSGGGGGGGPLGQHWKVATRKRPMPHTTESERLPSCAPLLSQSMFAPAFHVAASLQLILSPRVTSKHAP